jgi:hypothetical protein
VEALDVVEHVGTGLGLRQVATPIDSFAFEETKEPLHGGVVTAVADRAHAADDVVVFQEALVVGAGELGEFNPSSQHFLARGDDENEDPNIQARFAGKASLARTATRLASSSAMAVLASDRQRTEQRGCGHCCKCLHRCWNPMVQTMWRYATFASCAIGAAAVRPLFVIR